MGAGVSGLPVGIGPSSTALRTSNVAADSFVSELGQEVLYDKSMGSSRFIKTIRARHKQGPLVVKVFVKPDVSLSLKQIYRRIKNECDALIDCPNVLAYQRAIETERTGYLLRQWIASTLYDRISTRPFLTPMEKKWIAFQLLNALKSIRDKNLYHGDIKTENVLVTTWNWVYLTDLASFKPTFLPLDDPSTFTYFFDTSQRRTCYVAPERFFPPGSDVAAKKSSLQVGKRDGKVTEAMDIFSLGCVLAELWMDGTPPFTLTQLFQYSKGELRLDSYLNEIDDLSVRDLIRTMLELDPQKRLSCAEYLDRYRGKAFPDSFYDYFLPFFTSLNEMTGVQPASSSNSTAVAGTEADDRINQIWAEWDIVRSHLTDHADMSRSSTVRLNIPGLEDEPVRAATKQALIVLTFVSAHMRNCRRPTSVLKAIEILLALSRHLSDDTRLDRLMPYLVSLLQDDSAIVRATALQALTVTVDLVTRLTPANTSVFSEYILPNTRALAFDPETFPRVMYAQCIAKLANTATRFLELAETIKGKGNFRAEGFDNQATDTFESRLSELQSTVGDHLTFLLTDVSSEVRRALLEHIEGLCRFFGRVKSNDAILSHLITYLNIRDWQLRATWCEQAVTLAASVGPRSLEEYILPLLTLSLSDAEESVVHSVLTTLSALVQRRLLNRGRVWDLVSQTAGLLCHPNIWIREGTAAFLTTVSDSLETTDRWCILYPIIKRLLRADVKDINEISLLDNAREPLSRNLFEAAVAWAMRSPKSNFWTSSKTSSKGVPKDLSVRTDDDHAQLERLRQLGMKPEDEYKLGQLRDHITKLAIARHSSPSRSMSNNGAADNGSALPDASTLQSAGVVPQTIVLSIKSTAELLVAASSRRGDFGSRRVSMEAPSSVQGKQPVEDLRRRLAMTGVGAGGSNVSISGFRTPPAIDDQHPAFDSPVSPGSVSSAQGGPHQFDRLERTVSHTSTSTDDLSDTPSHLQSEGVHTVSKSRVHGNLVDVGKVGPAVAHDNTLAVGLLEARTKDDEAMSAVMSTPPPSGSPYRPPEQRVTSTYEGNDPNIKQLLERTYLDHFREPSVDLGPYVHAGVPRRRAVRSSFPRRDRSVAHPTGTLIGHLVEHTGAITDLAASVDHVFVVSGSEDGHVKVWDTMRFEKNVTSRSRQTWDQGGRITAVHVLDHSHCVASASTNGTVWLHRVDVSLGGPMPKYSSKAKLVRQHAVEGRGEYVTCMTSYNTETSINLVLATSMSKLVILDVQTMRNVQELQLPIQHGPISAIFLDPSHAWLVGGTLGGVLFLWDLRFNLVLRTWNASKPGRINRVALHPSRGKGRWIVVTLDTSVQMAGTSTEAELVAEVWDIDQGLRVEEYRVVPNPNANASVGGGGSSNSRVPSSRQLSSVENTMHDSHATPAAAIESLLSSSFVGFAAKRSDAKEPADARSGPNAKAMVVGLEYGVPTTEDDLGASNAGGGGGGGGGGSGGFMMTAGEDRKIRFWDLGKVERSVVVSGGSIDEDKVSYAVSNVPASSTSANSTTTNGAANKVRVVTEYPASTAIAGSSGATAGTRTRPGGRMHRSTVIANSQQHLLRAHQEAITALAMVDLPFRCIVSGDRKGVLKVFE